MIQIAIIIPVLHSAHSLTVLDISLNLVNHRLAHHSSALIYGCLNTHRMSSSWLHDALLKPPRASHAIVHRINLSDEKGALHSLAPKQEFSPPPGCTPWSKLSPLLCRWSSDWIKGTPKLVKLWPK